MKQIVILLLTAGAILYGKEYPVLSLSIDTVYGEGVHHFERKAFIDGLGHALEMKGNIELMYRAPYLLKVHISHYHKPNPHKGSKHRYKVHVKTKAYFWIKDRWGYVLYQGSVSNTISIDMRTSGNTSAYRSTIRSIFRDIGESVADRLNDSYRFLVDFEAQHTKHTHRPKGDHHIKHTGLTKLPSEMSLDIESGMPDRQNPLADVAWRNMYSKEDVHIFEPLGGARFAVLKDVSYSRINKAYVQQKRLDGTSITVFDHSRDFKAGTILIFKTVEGHYGKMKIIGFGAKDRIARDVLYVEWRLF